MTSPVSSAELTTATPVRRPPSGTTRFIKFVLSWPGVILANAIIFTIFFLARLGGGNTPEIFTIGAFRFRWYGLFITVGVILAALIAQYLAERKGENPDHIWRLLPVVLITGVAGARIWYVTNTWDDYKDDFPKVFRIWEGGIAIQGAVVGGIIGGLLYCYFARTKFWRITDLIAPGLILAQSIGRWGNFMNNEAYGRATNKPWGIAIPCQYRTTGTTPGTVNTACNTPADSAQLFHPTFFYESVWDYSVFITLFWIITHPRKTEKVIRRVPFLRNYVLRDGDVFLLYFVLYSLGRFFIESLRTDSLYLFGNTSLFRTAQALAIIEVLLGIAFLVYRHRKDSQLVAAPAVATESRPETPTQLVARRARRGGSVTAQTPAGDLLEEPVFVEGETPAARARHYNATTGSAVPGSKGGPAPAPRVRVRSTASTTATPVATLTPADAPATEEPTVDTANQIVVSADDMADKPSEGTSQS